MAPPLPARVHDNPTTSIRPPKDLLSLPKELLTIFCSQLDKQSAINLLFVHRELHVPAETIIYRDARLSPRKHKKWKTVLPINSWQPQAARDERKKAHKRLEEEMRLDAIIVGESALAAFSKQPRRWSYLKSVYIAPWWGAHIAIIQFLKFAREYIESLTIEMGEFVSGRNSASTSEKNSRFWSHFEQLTLTATSDFISLTSLSLRLREDDALNDVTTLLSLTPCLNELSIEYSGRKCKANSAPVGKSALESLRFCTTLRSFTCEVHVDNDGRDHALVTRIHKDAPLEELRYRNPMEYGKSGVHKCTLANDGRDLRLLEINCDAECRVDIHQRFHVKDLANLAILSMKADFYPEELAYRRLEFITLPNVVALPNLKTLVCGKMPTEPRPASQGSHAHPSGVFETESRQVQHLPDMEALVRLPNLTTILYHPRYLESLDGPASWEALGADGTVLRTIGHAGQTLIHARSYTRSAPLPPYDDDDIDEICNVYEEDDYSSFKYHSGDGTTEAVVFEGLDHPEWQDATHFEGLTVPMWVIGDMKRVEGCRTAWSGRHMEVSEKAWQVLLDWKAKAHPTHVSP